MDSGSAGLDTRSSISRVSSTAFGLGKGTKGYNQSILVYGNGSLLCWNLYHSIRKLNFQMIRLHLYCI